MFFVTLGRLLMRPDTVPTNENIVILHAGQASDRPRLLKCFEYNPRFEGLSLSALYIAATLDEAEAKAREDGWGPEMEKELLGGVDGQEREIK